MIILSMVDKIPGSGSPSEVFVLARLVLDLPLSSHWHSRDISGDECGALQMVTLATL